MSTPNQPTPRTPDDRLQQLVRMAIECEQLDAANAAAGVPTRHITEAAGQPIIARIGPAGPVTADDAAPSAAEIERLVRSHVGQLSINKPKGESNRGLWTGMVAASICMGLMLWTYRSAPRPASQPTPGPLAANNNGQKNTQETSQPTARKDAETRLATTDRIEAPPGFDQPLGSSRGNATSVGLVGSSALRMASTVPVFVVLKTDAGGCGCARVLPEELAEGWQAPEGTRVLYARSEPMTVRAVADTQADTQEAAARAADPSADTRGTLSPNDFACFHAGFAQNLSNSMRPTRSKAAATASQVCDGSTTAPMLQASDFLCFTSKFAGGCM